MNLKQTLKNNDMTTEQKMNYLENKFNAPIVIVMKAIRHCELNNIDVKEIELNEIK